MYLSYGLISYEAIKHLSSYYSSPGEGELDLLEVEVCAACLL